MHSRTTQRGLSVASYPLQIRIVQRYLLVSSPEWGIQISGGPVAESTFETIGKTVVIAMREVQKKIDDSRKRGMALPPVGSHISKNIQLTKLVSIQNAASYLQVSAGTVRRLVAKGFLRTIKTPGGHRRFTYGELAKFAAKARMPSISNEI